MTHTPLAKGQWVPVEHEFTANKLTTWDDGYEEGDGLTDWWIRIDDIATPLPDGIRICRLVAAPAVTGVPSEVAMTIRAGMKWEIRQLEKVGWFYSAEELTEQTARRLEVLAWLSQQQGGETNDTD